MVSGYTLSSDNNQMDIEAIHSFISRSYWANNIPKSILTRAVRNSLCFGAFTTTGAQVGFARLITDYATFAYLADVYILEEHRGKGLSKWLMRDIMEHPDVQGLRRINLVTRDAHGLYEKFGFSRLANPHGFMELHNPTIYQGL